MPAFGAELLFHVFGCGEAAVAAEEPGFEGCDAGERGGEEIESDAECYVLHGIIGG